MTSNYSEVCGSEWRFEGLEITLEDSYKHIRYPAVINVRLEVQDKQYQVSFCAADSTLVYYAVTIDISEYERARGLNRTLVSVSFERFGSWLLKLLQDVRLRTLESSIRLMTDATAEFCIFEPQLVSRPCIFRQRLSTPRFDELCKLLCDDYAYSQGRLEKTRCLFDKIRGLLREKCPALLLTPSVKPLWTTMFKAMAKEAERSPLGISIARNYAELAARPYQPAISRQITLQWNRTQKSALDRSTQNKFGKLEQELTEYPDSIQIDYVAETQGGYIIALLPGFNIFIASISSEQIDGVRYDEIARNVIVWAASGRLQCHGAKCDTETIKLTFVEAGKWTSDEVLCIDLHKASIETKLSVLISRLQKIETEREDLEQKMAIIYAQTRKKQPSLLSHMKPLLKGAD